MIELVHIAAQPIQIRHRYLRQRCGWCGSVLLDYDLANVARPLDEGEDPNNPEPWEPGTYETGALVAMVGGGPGEGGGAQWIVEPEMGDDGIADRLPDNACGLLDPSVTR